MRSWTSQSFCHSKAEGKWVLTELPQSNQASRERLDPHLGPQVIINRENRNKSRKRASNCQNMTIYHLRAITQSRKLMTRWNKDKQKSSVWKSNLKNTKFQLHFNWTKYQRFSLKIQPCLFNTNSWLKDSKCKGSPRFIALWQSIVRKTRCLKTCSHLHKN